MAAVMIIVRMSYGIYCRSHFTECRYRFLFDKGLIREMFSFAGWNFLGVSSGVLRDQGGNILVNLFSGPAVNAARAVAFQLNGAVQNFVTNFMTAVNPQITKSYASGDHEYMHSLLRKSSRMSFYLLFVLSLPVILNVDFVLSLWLKEVPAHASGFVQLFMIYALSESVSHPLVTAVMATGKIKNYQIVIGGLIFLNLPVSYAFLKTGCPPEVTVAVSIVISQLCLAARLLMLRRMIGLSVRDFLSRIYFNVLRVAAAGAAVAWLPVCLLPSGFVYSCLSLVLTFLAAVLSCLFLGCSSEERAYLFSMTAGWFRRRG
jgi:O-antigen/teichoic acid export membrane protein